MRAWNGKIKQRRSVLGRVKSSGRRSEATARANAELPMTIPQSKSCMWNDYVQNLRGGEVWRVAKFTSPLAGSTVEELTDRDGKQSNTIAEKEEILRGESFPWNDGDQYYELPPAGQAPERRTAQSVERALFSQSVKEAQGPDNQSFRAIRHLWNWDRTTIDGLKKASIRTGRYPPVCKHVSRLMIRKPGKNEYTKLKWYGKISLLCCMGKVVEKEIA
jgi:hypothetical protein